MNTVPPTRLSTTNPADGASTGSRFLERHEKLLVAGLFLVALALRLWHLAECRAHDPYFTLPSVDPRTYHEWAISIAQGDLIGKGHAFMSPLYPYFLGAVYAIFGPGFLVAKLIQCFIGAASCVLVYFIGKRIFDIRVGFLAAWIMALYVMLIFYDTLLFGANLQIALNLLCTLFLILSFEHPRSWRWWISGALLGLSALTRPNVLPFAGLVVLALPLLLRHRISRKRQVLHAAAFCAGVFLAVAPVALKNWIVGGDLVLISAQGGFNFYIGNGPGAQGTFWVPAFLPRGQADDPAEQRLVYHRYVERRLGREPKPSEVSDFWYAETWKHIQERPGEWLCLLGRKLGLVLNHREIPSSRDFYSSRSFSSVLRLPLPNFGLVAPLALLGFFLALGRLRQVFLLHAWVLTYTSTLVLFFVLAHYRLPMIPFLVLFASFALVWLVERVRRVTLKPLLLGGLGLLVAVPLVHLDLFDTEDVRYIAHYNLGNKFRSLGRAEEAMAQYEESIDLYFDYTPTHINLALMYERTPGGREKAIREWKIVLRLAQLQGDSNSFQQARRNLDRLQGGSGSPMSPSPG